MIMKSRFVLNFYGPREVFCLVAVLSSGYVLFSLVSCKLADILCFLKSTSIF